MLLTRRFKIVQLVWYVSHIVQCQSLTLSSASATNDLKAPTSTFEMIRIHAAVMNAIFVQLRYSVINKLVNGTLTVAGEARRIGIGGTYPSRFRGEASRD